MGCVRGESVPDAPALVPDAGGLQPLSSPLRIDFGRDSVGVIAAVSRLKNAPPSRDETLPECGRVVGWADGLTLIFRDEDFRGWRLGGDAAGANCG